MATLEPVVYLNFKKICINRAIRIFGRECFAKYIQEALQAYPEEPGKELSWMTDEGILVIGFH